jgi:hypothetical protein
LRARRKWPRCRAADKRDELAPPDVNCHATLPQGSCNGDDITANRAALRDFKPAYVGSGSTSDLRLPTFMSASTGCGHAAARDYAKLRTFRPIADSVYQSAQCPGLSLLKNLIMRVCKCCGPRQVFLQWIFWERRITPRCQSFTLRGIRCDC